MVAPLRGTGVGWPPEWELGWLVVGTVLIGLAVVAAVSIGRRRTPVWPTS